MSSKTSNKIINFKYQLKIHNVITTADLKQSIPIVRFNEFEWGRYDVEGNYNGKVAYVKDNNMQGRVTIFQSGKMISTGAKSVSHSIKQLKDSMKLMYKANIIKTVPLNFIVRNVVATLNMGKKLDLNYLAKNLEKSIYEPEQFPGLIFKIPNSSTFLIFSSGKMVITGAKSEEELIGCAKQIHEVVEKSLYN